MALNQLSDRAVRTAKPRATEYLLADGMGLFLRVRQNGSKSWQFIYTFDGKRRKLALGDLSALTLAAAREAATNARAEIASGLDPQLAVLRKIAAQSAKREALQAESRRETVRDVFNRWVKVDIAKHVDGGARVRRLFEVEVLPRIGKVFADELRKTHITQVTDALLARGVTRTAKLAFSLLRQMSRFAIDRGIMDRDPTASIRKTAIGGRDVERDRVLREVEIRLLAQAMPGAKLLPSSVAAIWLTLSTCCRIGELLAARWENVDLDARTWFIPGTDTKTRDALTVHLSDFAYGVFADLHCEKEARGLGGVSEWVFPDRSGSGPLDSKAVTKQIVDRQREGNPLGGRVTGAERALVLPGGRWTPHDLRRTGATMMVALGVLPVVADRCLNHREENRIRRTYFRYAYEAEKREAWRRLGDRLSSLVADAGEARAKSHQGQQVQLAGVPCALAA